MKNHCQLKKKANERKRTRFFEDTQEEPISLQKDDFEKEYLRLKSIEVKYTKKSTRGKRTVDEITKKISIAQFDGQMRISAIPVSHTVQGMLHFFLSTKFHSLPPWEPSIITTALGKSLKLFLEMTLAVSLIILEAITLLTSYISPLVWIPQSDTKLYTARICRTSSCYKFQIFLLFIQKEVNVNFSWNFNSIQLKQQELRYWLTNVGSSASVTNLMLTTVKDHLCECQIFITLSAKLRRNGNSSRKRERWRKGRKTKSKATWEDSPDHFFSRSLFLDLASAASLSFLTTCAIDHRGLRTSLAPASCLRSPQLSASWILEKKFAFEN